jgi:hypothetical protein
MATSVPDQTVEQLEDGIVSVLEGGALPDSTAVEPFPGNTEDYRMATQSALLVLYEREAFQPSQDEIDQLLSIERTPRFNIVCVSKKRRSDSRRQGHGPVYALIEYALRVLSGANIAGYEAVPETSQPLGLNPRDKTWRYQLTFELRN